MNHDASNQNRTSRFTRSWLARIASAFVVLLALGLIISFAFRSSNEAAIKNSRIVPIVTAKAEIHDFAEPEAVAQGSVATGSTVAISIPTGDANAVVTSVDVEPGTQISSGTLLGRVSGRPVIALNLPFSLYRTIAANDKGDDVRALQVALKELGFYYDDADGIYGASTSDAVKRLYGSLGVPAPTAGDSAASEAKEGSNNAADNGAEQGAHQGSQQGSQQAKQAAQLVPVPAHEFIAIDSTATVAAIAEVGATLGENKPFATLRIGATVARARVSVADTEAFTAGTRVRVVDTASGKLLSEGTVATVGEFQQANAEEGANVPGRDVVVHLDTPEGVTDGARIQIRPAAQASQKAALAVPATALREEAGAAYVLAKDGTKVNVTVGTVLDGWAEVSGDLAEGDEVQISTSGN